LGISPSANQITVVLDVSKWWWFGHMLTELLCIEWGYSWHPLLGFTHPEAIQSIAGCYGHSAFTGSSINCLSQQNHEFRMNKMVKQHVSQNN